MYVAVPIPPLRLFRLGGESRYDALGLFLHLLLHFGLSRKAFLSETLAGNAVMARTLPLQIVHATDNKRPPSVRPTERCRSSLSIYWSRLNCVMRTEPSGKIARISNWPPMASMNLPSVPIYMSVRRSILETLACLICSKAARCSWVRFRAARSSSRGNSRSIRLASASLSAQRSGDIFARSSLKFLAFAILDFL